MNKLFSRFIRQTEQVQVEIDEPEIFRTLFIHNPDMTFITDREGNVLEVNKSASDVTGFKKDTIIGKNLSSFIREEDRAEVLSAFHKVIKGKPQNIIFSIPRKNGQLIKVNNISIPLYKENQIIGAIGISKDITDEENLKMALELQNQKYKSLFDNHPDAIYTLNHDGEFTGYNEALPKLLGYSPEELAQSFKEVVADPYRKITLESFQKALKGQPQTYESVGINKKGELINVQITNVPIKVKGETVGVFGIAKNTTEFHQQQTELQRVKYNLNRAQAVAAIGSLEYDVEKDESLWSSQLYRILGVDPIEGPSPNFAVHLACIHPDDRLLFKENVNRLINEKGNMELECRILRDFGEVRHVHYKATYYIDDFGDAKITATVQDITEKKIIEQKLYENERKIAQINENLDVGIFSSDILERKILHFSKGVEGIFGYTPQEFNNDYDLWDRVIHKEDLKQVHREREKLKDGKIVRFEYRITHKNGEQRWVKVHSIPHLDDSGELIRVDGFVTDISEQKNWKKRSCIWLCMIT